MPATNNTSPATAGEGEVIMATITQSFRGISGATIHVLSDGRAVSEGILGLMLLTSVGGGFVRFLDDIREVAA